MTIVGNTLALLLVLSVLVVVHEFGHFAVAKGFRFPVEVFSFGFGKRLFGKKWKGTDYRVSAIPLGGYVRVIGLGPDESTVAEGSSTEAAPVGKRWQRALILLAGPFMNILLAWLLHTAVFALGVRVPAYEREAPVIKVVEKGSAGEAAGFQPGDRILSIAGKETPRWRDVHFVFGMNAREKLAVRDRTGRQDADARPSRPAPSRSTTSAMLGLLPDFGTSVRPRIAMVVSKSPAEAAGLKKGDVILSIAGKEIQGAPDEIFTTFVSAVSSAAPGPFPLVVPARGGDRNGERGDPAKKGTRGGSAFSRCRIFRK